MPVLAERYARVNAPVEPAAAACRLSIRPWDEPAIRKVESARRGANDEAATRGRRERFVFIRKTFFAGNGGRSRRGPRGAAV